MSKGQFALRYHSNLLMTIVFSCFSKSSCIMTLCFSRNFLTWISNQLTYVIVHYNLCLYKICSILQIFPFLFFNLLIICFFFSSWSLSPEVYLLYLVFERTCFKNYDVFLCSISLTSALIFLNFSLFL